MKRFALILAFAILPLLSCSKLEPTGFWNEYKKDLQVEHLNSQGPWGGHRTIFWKNPTPGTFKLNEIIDFAEDNGWTLIDSSKHTTDEIKSWSYSNNPIFPLTYIGFNHSEKKITATYENFPRWTSTDILVLHFKTGWVSIQPGSDETNEINGFITLNNNNTEMTLYHLWGE